MPLRVAVLACAFLLCAGCGAGTSSPTSVARSYEQAIVSRDGDRLCATFTPKLREVIGEQVTGEQRAAGATSVPRFDCGAFYHQLIGYPHENIDRQFESGKLLSVGSAHRATRQGVVYMRVPAKLRIEFTYTGYTTLRSGERGSANVDDNVWLSKGRGGKWGVVKPSLALVAAAGSPDVLYQTYTVARVNAAPPDPDYSMNRAERTAAEASDYRASFRRTIAHAPLRCGGKTVSVSDPLHDGVTYPTGSALHPAPAPRAIDITRVVVQAEGRRICVAVTFRQKPSGRLRVGFTPRSRKAFFPEYLVEIVPSRGVRGGGLTSGYRYFRGGEKLSHGAVDEISLYGRTVAFVANAAVVDRQFSAVPADLSWSVVSTAATGSDQVPNHASNDYVVIRQRDGRVVKL